MSYTPTEWQTGDTITAEKLNNMENGIEANDSKLTPLIITLTPTAQDYSGVTDTTMADIVAAYNAGRKIIFSMPAIGSEFYPSGCMLHSTNGVVDLVQVAANLVYYGADAYSLLYIFVSQSGEAYSVISFPLTPMS